MISKTEYCIVAGPQNDPNVFADGLEKETAEELINKICYIYPDTYWRIEQSNRLKG